MNEETIEKVISKHKLYMSMDSYEYEAITKVDLYKLIEEIERLKEELEYTIPIVEHNKTITKHLKEIERLNNKEEQLIRRLEDLIIVGEQVENEWAVDICKMIINELKGEDKE